MFLNPFNLTSFTQLLPFQSLLIYTVISLSISPHLHSYFPFNLSSFTQLFPFQSLLIYTVTSLSISPHFHSDLPYQTCRNLGPYLLLFLLLCQSRKKLLQYKQSKYIFSYICIKVQTLWVTAKTQCLNVFTSTHWKGGTFLC